MSQTGIPNTGKRQYTAANGTAAVADPGASPVWNLPSGKLTDAIVAVDSAGVIQFGEAGEYRVKARIPVQSPTGGEVSLNLRQDPSGDPSIIASDELTAPGGVAGQYSLEVDQLITVSESDIGQGSAQFDVRFIGSASEVIQTISGLENGRLTIEKTRSS